MAVNTKTRRPGYEAIELGWIANAYLDCAERLCKDLIEDKFDRSLHHYRVPLHLTFLGLELWFKAGIAAAGRPYPVKHDLVTLEQAYAPLYPKIQLPIPRYFARHIAKTIDLFIDHPAPDLEWHFQRLRYASDRKGRLFPQHEFLDVRELLPDLDKLIIAAHRLQLEIERKYATATKGKAKA